MSIKPLHELSVSGKRVLVRVDFNVARDKTTGAITEDLRIRETLPTIRFLIDQKAKVILASHLGRPKGHDPKESLVNVAAHLAELLDKEVVFPEECVGDAVRKLAHELKDGDVMLLENLRYHAEEEANDAHFSQQLAQLGEVYVSDAFGTLHRAHASTVGVAHHFKEKGMGFLVQKELECLNRLTTSPARPYWAVLGGAKVSDKIGLIENLLTKVDGILLGGGLAYTFMKALGQVVGRSKVEEDNVIVAHRILQKAKDRGVPVHLPVDHQVADQFSEKATARLVKTLGPDDMGLDVGPETVAQYAAILAEAKTIFWNGPMGVFEFPAFSTGTMGVAQAIVSSPGTSGPGGFSVVGGGESLAAIKKSGVADRIGHLSTGGGAALEYLEGRELPGLKALES